MSNVELAFKYFARDFPVIASLVVVKELDGDFLYIKLNSGWEYKYNVVEGGLYVRN